MPELPTMDQIIIWGGYAGLFVIIFAETGLLVGLFLPGDSLLVTAGLFAARGELDIFFLNILLMVAAIAGDATGYIIGLRAGAPLYDRPESRFFRREHLLRTKQFYERYGGITIVLARFMPFARTFAPVIAGVAKMKYRQFGIFNITGGILWIASMTCTGFFLGRFVPGIAEKIEYVILAVVFLSLLPMIIKILHIRLKKA